MSDEPSRNDVAQEPPADDLDLTGFPDGGTAPAAMFRAHGAEFGPWHFSDSRAGRFNLGHPNGTCYFAAAIATAVREYFGPRIRGNRLTPAAAAAIAVTRIEPPVGARYAHVSGNGAAAFGITAELTSMADYAVPQAWAEALKERFDGLRYDSRFDPGAESWALFGALGSEGVLGVVPNSTVDGVDAVRASGVVVRADPPRKSATRVIDPPA